MGLAGYPNTAITNWARESGVPVTLNNAWSNVIQLMSDAKIIDFEMVRADEDVDDGESWANGKKT